MGKDAHARNGSGERRHACAVGWGLWELEFLIQDAFLLQEHEWNMILKSWSEMEVQIYSASLQIYMFFLVWVTFKLKNDLNDFNNFANNNNNNGKLSS